MRGHVGESKGVSKQRSAGKFGASKKKKMKGKGHVGESKRKRKKKCRPVWCIQKKKGNLGHVTASKQRKTGHVGLSNESSITSHRFSFSCKAIKDSLKLLFTSSVNEENLRDERKILNVFER